MLDYNYFVRQGSFRSLKEKLRDERAYRNDTGNNVARSVIRSLGPSNVFPQRSLTSSIEAIIIVLAVTFHVLNDRSTVLRPSIRLVRVPRLLG